MKKKALIIIVIYILTIAVSANTSAEKNTTDEYQIVIESDNLENNIISFEVQQEALTNPIIDEITPTDLTSPSYTSLSISEADPITEGTTVTLQSTTTSTGMGVSSGDVDFIDFELYTVENDTTSDTVYSNKIAVKINIPDAITIYGFVIGVTPTIREDVNFYIRNSLSGADLKTGVISGNIGDSAHTDDQLLYVPFSYSGSSGSLSVATSTDYYFILEPTISTASTFFDITQSSNTIDNVGLYNWSGSAYQEIAADVHFYLITQQNMIADDEPVNSSGEVTQYWTPVTTGQHSVVAWYGGSMFYTESYGSELRTIVPSMETYYVSLDAASGGYQDEVIMQAHVLTEALVPAFGTSVQFSYSEDGQNWMPIGNSLCNESGYAILNYQFNLQVDNYSLLAKVNDVSSDESYLLIVPENIIWSNVDLEGQYRNNPGYPTDVKLSTMILVEDDDGLIVSNMDFDFWYYIDGKYERIPHAFTTNESGMFEVIYSIEDLTVGTYSNTHYFCPADYEINYVGDSTYGDSIVHKGDIDVEFNDYSIDWYEELEFIARITSIGEGVDNIAVEFAYYANSMWNTFATESTNSSGYASYTWDHVDLLMGNYPLRARALDTSLFNSNESVRNLSIAKRDLMIYIINEGEVRGNGEEIDVEYTTTMNLIFYVNFSDGSPAANLLIEVKGRLLGDVFYQTLGYITTNGTGHAILTTYEELDLVGYQYACIAEIVETGQHSGSQLYFKLNLQKCNPVIIITDHIGVKGTYVEFTAQFLNSEGLALENVVVRFIVDGVIIEGVTDHNGFVRVSYAPTFAAGQYALYCMSVEDAFFNSTQVEALFTFSKGTPFLSVLEAHGKVGNYITIKILAVDSLNRPIEGMDIRITFSSWSQILTTDEYGLIDYTFLAEDIEVGSYLLVLTFDGNNDWLETIETDSLVVNDSDSKLNLLQEAIIITYGDALVLEAILLSEYGDPLFGRTIEFVLFFENGTYLVLGQNSTDLAGYSQYELLIQLLPETYEIGVLYTGALDYGPSSNSTSLIVQKANSMLIGDNFEGIQNSTITFSVTLVDQFGAPIINQYVELYFWYENTWIYIGEFLTSSIGIAEISMTGPATLGIHYLRVDFNGNVYYNSVYLPLELTVVEPPPRIVPSIVLIANKTTVAIYEQAQITISVTNAVLGAAIEAFIFVDDILFDSIVITNGLTVYSWNSSEIGDFVIKFVTIEDSVYEVAVESITINVVANLPPELVSYSFKDYMCEGEVFYLEVVVSDSSGIYKVWCVLNGTKYEMQYNDGIYEITIFLLQIGHYQLSIQAEDEQGNVGNYPLDDELTVHNKKTQVINYHIDSLVVEEDQDFIFTTLVFAENTIDEVIMIINSTEYQMVLEYQLDQYRSVWTITVESLEVGIFEIGIKIVDSADGIFEDDIKELLTIIPKTPLLAENKWVITQNGSGDYITGNITINSYYELNVVQIWIDDQLVTVTKIGENLYSYYGTVATAKSHMMKVRAVDVNNRVLETEISLVLNIGANILMISLLVSGILLAVLISGGTIFVTKYLKKKSNEESSTLIELPDIEDFTESTMSEDEAMDLFEEIETIHSTEEEQLTPEENLFDTESTTLPETVIVASVCPASIESEETEETEEVADDNLKQVKEYLQKVKDDGLIEYVNGSKENGNGASVSSIDQLNTFSVEIDQRVLPKEELSAKLEEEKLAQSSVFDLKEITEEIEHTLSG